jgi:3-dehydroquinate dehydratase-2
MPRGLRGKVRQLRPLSVLVVSGPNLDRLGKRQPELYGTTTLDEIHEQLVDIAQRERVRLETRQSASEGELVGWVNRAKDDGFAGVLLNAGGYTHTSVALLDAVLAAGVPVVEVHLTLPEAREDFRQVSVIARGCIAKVAGFGADSYAVAFHGLLRRLRAGSSSALPR